MIKYRLKCENCEKIYDSWFSSSKEFEKLKKKGFINCHFCNSKSVIKTLMAPNILNVKKQNTNFVNSKENNDIKKKILKFKNFIKKNFEYVGNDFSYKARTIHYNRENKKGIYGNASKKQIQELQEEGIDAQIFPWIEDNNN